MSCFKNKSMFVFNMGYFFRIWAKTRQTFSKSPMMSYFSGNV